MKSTNYADLEVFMLSATSVKHWNELREIAKEDFDIALIRKLDGSGFIHKVLPKYVINS
jgi:hypothetical protein